MIRIDTLGAVSLLSYIKANSPPEKSDKFSSKEDAIRLQGNEKSATVKILETKSIHSQNITNKDPNNCQPVLKNLSYTDNLEQGHESLIEKTSVTIQNNNVESLPSIYFTRPTCGNTYTTKAPKRCGISMTNGNKIVTFHI